MNGLILFTGVVFLLWLGRVILIPLLVATFLWYLINAISAYCRKILPFRDDAARTQHSFLSVLFDWLANCIGIGALMGLVCLFIVQVRPMFLELVAALPAIQNKLIDLGMMLSHTIGIKFDMSMIPNVAKMATNVGVSLAGMATTIGMIVIYLLFMFVEQTTFDKKFSALFPNRSQSKKMRYIVDSIDTNMKKYLFMKTLISGATGILAYLWLHFLGLEFAGVWAFIVFITSYIPTIGAIIACSLPILYSLAVSPNLQTPILVATGLIGLQILLANIIEPKLTGKTLNLSTLAILINLVFWGLLWGVAGMFFSVPLLVATFIITAQFDSTRWIAVLLSADGTIPDKRESE